jgi:hypothetical protein
MAWNRHAIAQTQLQREHRVDGVGRPKNNAIDARRSLPIVYLIYLAFQVDPEEVGAGGIY